MTQERPARLERRLAAILAADVAGYSRLMHAEEEATHTRLTSLLAEVVDPAIAEHGGRVVKIPETGCSQSFQVLSKRPGPRCNSKSGSGKFQSTIRKIGEF